MAAFDAFMIPNSPKNKSDKKDIVNPKEVLLLAPFNPIPKILFQNVKVGHLISQDLRIQNPGSTDVQVELSSKVSLADHNLEITSTEFEVGAGQGLDLSIKWKPREAGTVKVPICVRTNSRFRCELTILGVAVAPNKTQKKILGTQNSEKRVPDVAPAPRSQKSHSKSPERRKTFVLRSNKENVNSGKPKPAPRKLASAATMAHSSRFENLVISPLVSSHHRFKDVELSPAVPLKPEHISPVHEAIRRETYGIRESKALPFIEEEDADTVDCLFRDNDSFANGFQPDLCSTVKKTVDECFGERNERLSGETYLVDRLSTDTYIKELSGSILESINDDAETPAQTVLIISPPKQLKETVRMSPTVVTKRKIAVIPEITFTPPEEYEREATEISGAVPRVAMPRLTLTRTTPPPRQSFAKNSYRPNPSRCVVSRQSISAASSSRQSLASAANSSRQSLSSAASLSRQSLASAASLSRQSLASAASSSRQSLTSAASSSRQSLTSAASSSRQSLASAASSSRQSFTSAASSRQSLSNAHSSSRQSLTSAHSSSLQSLNSSVMSVNSNSRMLRVKSTAKGKRQEKSEFLYDTDALISEMINNDLVAASTSADPFLTNTLYFDDSWKLRQERDIIKWLNVMLTPAAELAADTNSASVDIADVWQRCCRSDKLELAPTREEVSADHFDAQGRLNSLRKAAITFLAKTEVREVLGKVSVHVDKKLLFVREDKDLHLDMGLKYQILDLLLSYNTLWLRIGLEAVYGRTVSLASNSDVMGLTKFMMENLLYDRSIVAMHSHPTVPHLRLPTFGDAMKKFILKKFFYLVYFLDQAKKSRLIGHDPCLFMKKSKYKESREILLAFSSMFLSGVGDVIKHLALLGYHVSVKQQYIDEYEFAVACLKDLRDGVILVRLMEIILKDDTLMAKLRVPAISMLQKVHNMEVALKALSDAGYVIMGNITPKDLVNGHYEKTLSLLWQIIYKFQAPRLERAARKIQFWWIKLKLYREIKNRIRARKKAMYAAAATRIQAAWRARLARKLIALLREERVAEMARREAAAIVIQKTWRMHAARKQLIRAREASNRIKEWFGGAMITRELRGRFLAKRQAAIQVQAVVRGYLTRKRMANLRRTAAALRIQTWFRRRRAAKLLEVASTHARAWMEERKRQTQACLVIQARFRAQIEMKKQRNNYVTLLSATIIVQRRFRLLLLMKKDRVAFLALRRSAIVCQQVFRAQIAMKMQRAQFLAARMAAVTIQRRFRASLSMREARNKFLQKKSAAVTVQKWFRATQQMQADRQEYLRKKRAVGIIKERYLGWLEMRRQKLLFETMRTCAVVIQRWYRSVKQMEQQRSAYLRQRNAALVIQRSYRTFKLNQLRNSSAIAIQRKWRATLQMRAERKAYKTLQSAAVTIQTWWRVLVAKEKEKAEREARQEAATVIQRQWRAIQTGKKERQNYLNLRNAAVVLQRRWRAKHLMELQMKQYLALKAATVFVQCRYRYKIALRSGVAARARDQAAALIQAVWRGYLTRKKQSAAFAEMHERCKNAAKAACEDKTLASISLKAFNLLRSGQCNKAMEALVALNKITVLSKKLCISLAEDGAVTVIYNFLCELNRSEVHRQLLIQGTAVLLNLAKCGETVHFVWQNGSRTYFYLHLMNVYIIKEEEIFLNCATVLWHFAHYPECVNEMMSEPQTGRYLEIFARKAYKQTTLSGANGNSNVLPAETPSWGLVLKDGRPSRFGSAQFAVQILMSVLYRN